MFQFELSNFSFMICNKVCKFPIADMCILYVPLSYLSFFMVCDLTYSTVICYEGGKLSNADTLVSCVYPSILRSVI